MIKCLIFSCEKTIRKGMNLCNMHYARYNRYGSTDIVKCIRYNNKLCSCGNKIRAKGLCQKCYTKKRYQEHPELRIIVKKYQKIWRQRPEIRAKERIRLREWKKNNPSSSYKFGLETQIAMDTARIRDKNTCQWYGCGKTHKETEIHAHHIFPRSEYPELETISQYIICYCSKHHILWHEMRGDKIVPVMKGRLKLQEIQVVT